MLLIEWQDVLTAAQPYLAELQNQEAFLNAAAPLLLEPKIFELGESQPRYGPSLPADLTTPEILLRQAQWALYHDGLYQSPTVLGKQLSERQVALWLASTQDPWALSTQQSTVLLPDCEKGPRINLVVTHPAKGAGFRSLQVGELVLYDTYQSPVLAHLAAALELWGNAKVVHSDGSDC